MPKDRKAAEKLFEFAVQQQGYFTQKQAMLAGYNRNATYFYSKTGEWIREKRGIYRLAKFPLADRPDLVVWALWSANRRGAIQGVFSHATALSLYNITDANPAKLHMTVPPSFRKHNPIPPGIILHRAEIAESEKRKLQGYFVTTPLKTLQDMYSAKLLEDSEIRLAAKQAVQKGLMTPDESDQFKF